MLVGSLSRERLLLMPLLMVVMVVGALLSVDRAAAQGKRQTVVDTKRGTSAELSFTVDGGTFTSYKDIRIRIEREGTMLVDQSVPDPPRGIAGGTPFPPGHEGVDGLFIRDLDRDHEPEVQIDLFSGGANCCLYSTVFAFDPDRGSYRRTQQVWGGGYRLRNVNRDGRPEFMATDYRWKYLFACNACQRPPPRLLAFSQHRFEDVTRRFPKMIRRDAHFQLRLVRKRDPFSYRGAVASLTADRCLLGRCPAALRRVRGLLRAGHLDKHGRYDYPPWGSAYVRKLARVLRRFGYR